MADPKGSLSTPCAFDPDGKLRALEVDADDHLIVSLGGGAGVDTQPHGYLDGAWHKQGMPIGFSDWVGEWLVDDNLGAGTVYISGAVVPAWEVWIIVACNARYSGTITNVKLGFAVNHAGDDYYMFNNTSVTSNNHNTHFGQFIMFPGDYMKLQIVSATAGNDCWFSYNGYKLFTSL